VTICLGDWEKIFKITSGASEGTGCTKSGLIGAATPANLKIVIQPPTLTTSHGLSTSYSSRLRVVKKMLPLCTSMVSQLAALPREANASI